MTRRQFLQVWAWWTVAAALRVKTDAAALVVPAPRLPAWGVPWQVNWMIGAEKPERVYLPAVSK